MAQTPLHEQHLGRGIVFAILASLCLALTSLIVKIIGPDSPTALSLFARYTVSMLLIFPWVLKKPAETIKTTQPRQIYARSFFTLLSVTGFFYALKFIPLANAILLTNTYPLFVPIVVWVLYKVKTPPKAWGGIAVGFIGILLVLKPDPHSFQAASWIALLSGCTAAVAIVLIRSLTKVVPVLQIIFYNFLVGILITGMFLPFTPQPVYSKILLPLFLLGVFGLGYQIFSTLALAKSPARYVSPFMYFAVIFGALFDFLYFQNTLDLFTAVGITVVILGGTLTIYGSK